MGYFQVRYDSRVVNFERKLFIRLAIGVVVIGGVANLINSLRFKVTTSVTRC